VQRERPRILLGCEALVGDVPHQAVGHRARVIQLERRGYQAYRGRAVGGSPAPGLEVHRLAPAQLFQGGLYVRRLIERAEQVDQLPSHWLGVAPQHAAEPWSGSDHPAFSVKERQSDGRDVECCRQQAVLP
jgi:hypothetical protein